MEVLAALLLALVLSVGMRRALQGPGGIPGGYTPPPESEEPSSAPGLSRDDEGEPALWEEDDPCLPGRDRKSATTTLRTTRLFSEDEREEVVDVLRRARRKP